METYSCTFKTGGIGTKVSDQTIYLDPKTLTCFILEAPTGVLAKSADLDQMPHNVASDSGLHYFARCSAIFQQK